MWLFKFTFHRMEYLKNGKARPPSSADSRLLVLLLPDMLISTSEDKKSHRLILPLCSIHERIASGCYAVCPCRSLLDGNVCASAVHHPSLGQHRVREASVIVSVSASASASASVPSSDYANGNVSALPERYCSGGCGGKHLDRLPCSGL